MFANLLSRCSRRRKSRQWRQFLDTYFFGIERKPCAFKVLSLTSALFLMERNLDRFPCLCVFEAVLQVGNVPATLADALRERQASHYRRANPSAPARLADALTERQATFYRRANPLILVTDEDHLEECMKVVRKYENANGLFSIYKDILKDLNLPEEPLLQQALDYLKMEAMHKPRTIQEQRKLVGGYICKVFGLTFSQRWNYFYRKGEWLHKKQLYQQYSAYVKGIMVQRQLQQYNG